MSQYPIQISTQLYCLLRVRLALYGGHRGNKLKMFSYQTVMSKLLGALLRNKTN